ncbi:MAG: helix-turn-helix domain-containing protein [Bryobacteraceae bacterium]
MNTGLCIGIKDAAALLGLSPWTIRRFIRLGKLASVRIGRRVLVEPAELEKLVEAGRAEAGR